MMAMSCSSIERLQRAKEILEYCDVRPDVSRDQEQGGPLHDIVKGRVYT